MQEMQSLRSNIVQSHAYPESDFHHELKNNASGDPTSLGEDNGSRPDTSGIPMGEETKLSYLKYQDEHFKEDSENENENEGGV